MKQELHRITEYTLLAVSRHACPAFLAALFLCLPARTLAADHALSFATQTQIVSTTGMVTTAAFTYEAWFKITTFAGENQVVAQYANHPGRLIVGAKTTKAWFFIGGTSLDGVATLPSNTWTHIAVTRSNSTAKIYINGVLDKSSTSFNTNSLPLTGITIGGLSSLNFGFKGQIAEVRAWNTELTQAQIQARKDSRLAGTEANLVGYWRLDEGLGGVALDHCGNSHGTISGASWTYGVNLPVSTSDPSGSWSAATGGNWSDTAKWFGSTPAQGACGSAFFTNTASAISIANDLSPLPLGRILLSGAGGYTLTGNEITLTNQTVAALIACTNGSHTISAPLTVNASRLFLETRYPANLYLSSVISSSAGVFANLSTSGGGSVTLSGANTFTGPVILGCGTLTVGALADAGSPSPLGASSADPANLQLGPGTLRLAGPASSTDRCVTLAPGSGKASLVSVDTNATFGGTVKALSGALIKRGKGSLALTGLGSNILSVAQSGNLNGFAEFPANGDSPANGFAGLTVVEGKLTLGVPGQTNIVNGEAWVGVRSTALAGKEVAGELEINGGYTRMNSYLCIGRDTGTTNTAPVPLQPKLTITDGTLSIVNLIIAYGNTTNNTRPVVNIQGGTFEIDDQFRFGDQRGDPVVPMLATLNLYGGTVRHTNPAPSTQGMVFGWRDPGCNGTLNLFGGLVDERYQVKLGQYGSTSRLNLHGGVLRAQNIIQSNPNTNYGQSYLYWNGGTFQPNAAAQILSGLTSATVSTNGACIDTSLADFTVTQNLLHDSVLGASPDGGLVKLGTNTLTFASYGSTYSGATTVSNGTLLIASTLPSASALVVAPDAEALIGGSATQTVSAASLALDSAGTLSFAFALDGSSNDRLALAASPALAGRRLALYCLNTRATFSKSGTYTLMTYGGADPDTTGLVCANPVVGKRYTFSSGSGALTVTISSDTSAASVWNTDGSGNWADAGNWTLTAPSNGPASVARLDSVITAPVTVTTAGETVGSIFLNNLNAYTLGGSGLTLDNNDEPAALNVELGTHTVTAPLTLAGDAVADLAPATTLSLGDVSGASSTLTAQGNGTLLLAAPPSIQSLTLNNAELAFSNSMTVTTPVELQRAVTVRPNTNTTVTVNALISGSGGLIKAGSNTLALAAGNSYTGATRIDGGTLAVASLANGGQPSSIGASAADSANLFIGPATLRYTGPTVTTDRGLSAQPGIFKVSLLHTENDLTLGGKIQVAGCIRKTGPGTLRLTYPGEQFLGTSETNIDVVATLLPNGDSPALGFQALTISNGKLVVGLPGQTNRVNARMCVGHCTTLAPSAETAGELEINGGAFFGNGTVSLGRANGNNTTAPGGLSSRITINGGAVTFSLLALGYNAVSGYSGFNARPVCDVNAGTLTVSSYCNIGEASGSTATLNINGGYVRFNGKHTSIPAGVLLGGPASAGNGTLNVNGTGVVYCVNNVAFCTVNNATGTLNLNGGMLTASNIVKHTTGTAVLRFNGGTFQPLTHGLILTNLTAAYVSTNGALFETSLANGYTVAQNLLTDPGLGGARDGGFVKLGTNTLSLTGAGNTFNGPVDVRNGLLRARLGGTNDLNVAATNAFFDALGERATVGDLTGIGTLTNGVIAVTGTLDAGTNSAPAGAKLTVENLGLAPGSTFVCEWSTNALGRITNDFVAVTGSLAAEGPGFVDFGRSEADPIMLPFKTTIMSYGTFTGSFAGWKALNTGLPPSTGKALLITAEAGLVKLEVRSGGTLFMVR